VGHPQAGLFGDWDELLDGVEAALVAEGLEQGGASQVGLLGPCERGR
jgi:hypothetical protein